MARIRRPKKINGSEYTFGGGSGVVDAVTGGDFVKIAFGNRNRTNAAFNRFLKNGDTVKITTDQNVASSPRDEYIYFDNAFESDTGTVTLEYLNGDTAMPAGMSFQADTDTVNADAGFGRIYGTPTAVGQNSFKIKVDYPAGRDDEQSEITYVLNVLPVGFTPVWNTFLSNRIIWKTSDEQTLSSGPTTGYSGATYTLSNLSGFPSSVRPLIDPATGRVYVAGVGNIEQIASTHSYTVTADLGEYGTVAQGFSGLVSYGRLFGSVYYGPGNAKADMSNYQSVQGNAANHMTDEQVSTLFNNSVTAGALRRRDQTDFTTSPYRYNEDFGLVYNENPIFSTGTTGQLGPHKASTHSTSLNGYVNKLFWYVPDGVTSFSVVCVGGGAGGAYTWANQGGGSAGLAWVNEVICTPGEKFEIAVGLGRYSESGNSSYWAGSTWLRRVVDAGYGANEFIAIGYGGGYQNGHPAPLSARANPQSANLYHTEFYQYNNSRDAGSAAASINYGTYGAYHGGGAGAYPGAGAAGYVADAPNSTASSANGLGGGGGSGGDYSSTYGNSGGGGVGLDGQGSGGHDGLGSGYGGKLGEPATDRELDGTAPYRYGGGGGSGGSRGAYGENPWTSTGGVQNRWINGGDHGGGGGGSGTSWGGGAGGNGGIRMIWGMGGDNEDQPRAFPSTYTTEDVTIADSTAQ